MKGVVPPRIRMPVRRAAVALALLASPAAHAQSEEARFREIEPGFEDSALFAENQRLTPADLRTPMGFDRVYEVLGADGLFARRSGAITAVFDRSVYLRSGTPAIPPGTVFYVGDLPIDLHRPGLLAPLPFEAAAPPTSFHRAPNAVSTAAPTASESLAVPARIDRRADAASPPPPTDPARSEQVSIWTDETYRKHRLGSLIRRAAAAARTRTSD